MLKCRICDCPINDVVALILVVPVASKPRAYCQVACLCLGELADQKAAINRVPHRKRSVASKD